MKRLPTPERADDGTTVPSVRLDGPNAPKAAVAKALCFEGTEHEPTVLARCRMQRAADAHRRDGRDVLAIIVHDEELKRRRRVTARRSIAVAIAGESDFAARHG